MAQHCCEAMTRQVEDWHCNKHADKHDCADALISFTGKFQEYALIIHDGDPSIPHGSTSGGVVISYCPWCGAHLPESQRDRWLQEMERRGTDPRTGDVPAEFQDDRWLHSQP